MPGTKSRSLSISRRTLLGAASVAPVICKVGPAEGQDVVAQCAEWLAVDAEIEHLTLQWAALDAIVMRERRWSGVSTSERQTAPSSAELSEIESQLSLLDDKREGCFEALAKRPVRTLHGVASKLAVAARSLDGEGGPVYHIVAEAVAVLGAHRCSGCGEPHLPAACRYPERL